MTLSSFSGSQAVLSGGTDQYNTELSTSLIFTAHNVSSDGNYSGTWTTVTQSGRLNTRKHMNHAIAELGGAKAVLFGGPMVGKVEMYITPTPGCSTVQNPTILKIMVTGSYLGHACICRAPHRPSARTTH